MADNDPLIFHVWQDPRENVACYNWRDGRRGELGSYSWGRSDLRQILTFYPQHPSLAKKGCKLKAEELKSSERQTVETCWLQLLLGKE